MVNGVECHCWVWAKNERPKTPGILLTADFDPDEVTALVLGSCRAVRHGPLSLSASREGPRRPSFLRTPPHPSMIVSDGWS